MSRVLIVLSACLSANVFAQDRLELGGFLGTSYYMGDLNPATPFKNSHLALGGFARYALSDRWALKGTGTIGGLSGSYPQNGLLFAVGPDDTYSFNRKFGDVALMSEFNFLSYDHRFLSNTVFTTYITVGLASIVYKRKENRGGNESRPTVFVLSLPFGFGVKYKITEWMRIGAEWTMRKTFVDDLDDAGATTSVDPTDPYGFGTKEISHNNDWYSFAGVTVSFNMLKRRSSCNGGY
ncbi:MAG: DUF6089 family protein [Breznakibacter sp.]